MKRSLTLLLVSLLAAFSLTACGGKDSQNSGTNQDSAVTGENAVDGTDRGEADAGKDGNSGKDESLLEDAEQGVDDAVKDTENALDDAVKDTENALDDMTGNDRMRSALVHDRDGDLTDMENGAARSSTR